MGVDASVYSQFKPIDLANAYSQGQQIRDNNIKMSEFANQRNSADQQKKLLAVGGAIEDLAGMPEEQRAGAYKNHVNNLIKNGVINPDDAPPEYDQGYVRTVFSRLNNDPQWLSIKNAQAQIASSKNDPIDRDLDRQIKKSTVAKNYAEAEKEKNEKVPNQSQFAAATFGTRANQAENVFSDLAKKGFDPTTAYNVAQSNFPSFLEGNKSGEVKQQEQAKRNFVNAILRRESGAAISASEFDSAGQQYFPQYGDNSDVLKQKEANRKTAIAALNAEGAPAMSRISKNMGAMTIGDSVPANKKQSQSLDMNEAQASTMPPPPQGKIMMRAPNGKIVYVSESEKGEAIAAGGSVVK